MVFSVILCYDGKWAVLFCASFRLIKLPEKSDFDQILCSQILYFKITHSNPAVTLVSVRRVVPSSEVTTETWELGVPGSSSMVTVSSTTSCGSCIIARDVALLGLCSWIEGGEGGNELKQSGLNKQIFLIAVAQHGEKQLLGNHLLDIQQDESATALPQQ